MSPDAVAFPGVLCACEHGGLVGRGKEYLRRMSEECGCVVDLYDSSGLMEEAWDMINPCEPPDVLVLIHLLCGSRIYGNIKICETAIKKPFWERTNSSANVLSNFHAKMGKWNEVREI